MVRGRSGVEIQGGSAPDGLVRRSGGASRGALALATALLFAGAATAQTVLEGYEADAVSVAQAGAFVGGLELLPNGNYAVYDGAAVLELHPADGSTIGALYTPSGAPFGAFLSMGPAGAFLYFGESSGGTVTEIDLSDLSTRVLTTTVFPYDRCFDPSGRAFLSWSPGFGLGSFVSYVDLASGVLTDVVHSDEASGPVVSSADGGLYYGFSDARNWPPDPDTTRLVWYSRSQLDAVLGGGGALGESDGILVARVDGAADLELDESGDLFVSDNAYYKLTEIDLETGVERILYDGSDYQGLTFLAYRSAGPERVFEWYQTPDSGELITVATDYFSFNEALRVRPARATLSTDPASPVPSGPFDFELSGGVPGGFALLFVTEGVGAEFRGNNRSWNSPLWWELDFAGGILLSLGFSLDGAGALSVAANNPGLGGFGVGVQAVVGASASGPYYATSAVLDLVLQ